MDIPDDILIKSISDGDVYYFSSTKIQSNEPHNFICVKKGNNDILVMACCSSKYETSLKYIKRQGISEDTLVYLDPAINTYLKKHTFVNCNNAFPFTKQEFLAKYRKNEIKFKGKVDSEDYDKIKNGLLISPDVEEEIKDIIRSI